MPVEVLRLLVRVVRDQVPELGVGHDHSEPIPPLLKLFRPRLLIIVERADNLGMLIHQGLGQSKLLSLFGRVDDVVCFFFVKGCFGTFLSQVRIDNLALDRATENFGVK